MAKYEVSTARLIDAGADFKRFSGGMDDVRRRIDRVITALQDDSLFELKKQLIKETDAVSAAAADAGKMGQTLADVSDIYNRAERSAFAGGETEPAASPAASVPPIRRPSGFLYFGDLIMPDWLTAAVLRYEQSQS